MAHFEVVRTSAPQPWHVRLIASNGSVMLTSENYTRRSAALTAIAVAAEAFGVAMNRPPTLDPSAYPKPSARLIGVPSLSPGREISFDVREIDER